jgi:acyl-CoA synthetase (AMP-forming)/AMP-acid ligase II
VTVTTSLANLLIDHPFAAGEPLLHSRDETMTAEQACAEARAVAASLRDVGVTPGTGVAVQMPNGPHVITAMVGVWLARGVFVPVNPRAPEPEVARVLEATRPAVLMRAIDRFETDPSAEPRVYAPDTAFVIWTSGTTGAPKPILHTHSAYLELLDRVLAPLRGTKRSEPPDATRRPSPNLIPVSLALNAGIYNVLFGLRAGSAIVVMDGFVTDAFAELVSRFAIRSTVLPPAAITMLADDPGVVDLSPLRFVRSITAPLSPLQARRFMDKFGVVVLNSYGQAEIGEVVGWTAADAREHPEKIGALGRPHPGVDIKIVDDDGAPVGAGGAGRLVVRPPNVTAGEAGGGGLADRIDADGYLDTGDVARVDGDGFVWIEGRAGDVINRGGNKVFPDQVEEVLRLAPGVSDAAVVGVADARLGEVPVAFVVSDGGVTDDELRATCREHLAPYKVPVAFHRIDALPRSEVGKVLRRELLDRAGP